MVVIEKEKEKECVNVIVVVVREKEKNRTERAPFNNVVGCGSPLVSFFLSFFPF